MNPRRIRTQMNSLGLSIARLAEKADLSESTIKRALNGEKMSSTTAELLAKALDADLDWLREEDEPGSEPGQTENEVIEPEDTDMKAALEAVERAYISRIEDLKSHVNDLKKDKFHDRILAIALIAFICALFTYDILNPSAGWFQY